jgi:hypothetical protein
VTYRGVCTDKLLIVILMSVVVVHGSYPVERAAASDGSPTTDGNRAVYETGVWLVLR